MQKYYTFMIARNDKNDGLGSRIRDVDAFWYKTEIKIIYFVQLCLIALIVCDLTLIFYIKN